MLQKMLHSTKILQDVYKRQNGNGENSNNMVSPQTGDASNYMIWISVAGVSVVAMVVLFVMKKKRNT